MVLLLVIPLVFGEVGVRLSFAVLFDTAVLGLDEGVAEPGPAELKRAVFSLMVAESTVFWRLKLELVPELGCVVCLSELLPEVELGVVVALLVVVGLGTAVGG